MSNQLMLRNAAFIFVKSNTYFQGAAGEDDEARQRGSDEVDDEACGSTGLDDDDEARGGARRGRSSGRRG